MNIWYFNHYAGGPGLGKYVRAYHLARAWATLGHQTTVFVDYSWAAYRLPTCVPEEIDKPDAIIVSSPILSRSCRRRGWRSATARNSPSRFEISGRCL